MQAELLTFILGVINEVSRLIELCLTSLSTGYRVKLLVQLPLFTMPEFKAGEPWPWPLGAFEEELISGFTMPEVFVSRILSSGVGKSENDSSSTHKGRPYICNVCRIELSSKQSLASHLNKHKAERAPSVTAQFGGRAATSSFSRTVEESGVIGGSTTGDNVAGNFHHQTISFQLQSKDLPSRRLLGKGLAGYGYETTWKGERFVRKDFIGVPRRIFEKEVTVLTGLENHKNIVKTYGWTADKRSCSLVLEYMENDLLSLLEKRNEIEQDLADIGAGCLSSAPTIKGPFDLPQAVDIMLQIAAGMKALHEQRIAHGDLKTKNILVTSVNNIDQNLMTVKVTDFGLVRSKKESKFIVSRQVQKLDMIQWKAPEYFIVRFKELNNLSNDRDGIIFSESGSSSESETESEASATSLVVNMRLPGVDVFAADVYSFGLICSHVLTGNDPYPNLNWKELGFKVLSGLRPSLPAECPALLRDLLESCWSDDPTQRPTFSTIHLRLEDFHASVFLTSACAARRIQKAFRSHNEKKRQLAANRIQQKFRSWKVRKDFLNLRQQVVRIQAYMRGERVRRGLRKLRWSIGVLEKGWERKEWGQQGFKSGDVTNIKENESGDVVNIKENDEEFLKSGRRQAESKATVGRFEEGPFVSFDLGRCKLEMQQKIIPMFSSRTDDIMSRHRLIAPKPKSKTGETDKISSKPMPKTEGIDQTDSHSTLSSLSISELHQMKIGRSELQNHMRKKRTTYSSRSSERFRGPLWKAPFLLPKSRSDSILGGRVEFQPTDFSNSHSNSSLTMSSKGSCTEEDVGLCDSYLPGSFEHPGAWLSLGSASTGTSQVDSERQIIDAHYLEQRYGGSSEPLMLTDLMDTVLWVNSTFKRLSMEKTSMQAIGPHIDPLGIRTHLATVKFQPSFPASKCKATLWAFFKKFVMVSEAGKGQAQAKVLAPQPVRAVGSTITVQTIVTVDPHSAPLTDGLKYVQESLEKGHMPSVLTDLKFRVRWVNTAYKRLVGQPKCSLLPSAGRASAVDYSLQPSRWPSAGRTSAFHDYSLQPSRLPSAGRASAFDDLLPSSLRSAIGASAVDDSLPSSLRSAIGASAVDDSLPSSLRSAIGASAVDDSLPSWFTSAFKNSLPSRLRSAIGASADDDSLPSLCLLPDDVSLVCDGSLLPANTAAFTCQARIQWSHEGEHSVVSVPSQVVRLDDATDGSLYVWRFKTTTSPGTWEQVSVESREKILLKMRNKTLLEC
ncbi:hypothetical protein KC19_12G032200 [Ceratodon purpureus]|uniref:Uncharacterized protein n=1 Tax=Ceratodon purpureus TaxID=3225 RepID=A0A8T0G745_CERPU|nr:hypothetical protein KC19_12G032200 [Ceratodon purpureus]